MQILEYGFSADYQKTILTLADGRVAEISTDLLTPAGSQIIGETLAIEVIVDATWSAQDQDWRNDELVSTDYLSLEAHIDNILDRPETLRIIAQELGRQSGLEWGVIGRQNASQVNAFTYTVYAQTFTDLTLLVQGWALINSVACIGHKTKQSTALVA